MSCREVSTYRGLKGGFGEVYKGTLRGHNIAVKYVKRETPTNLKDFNRELKALRLSEKCKSNIIKFFGLSHDPRRKEYILVMQFANNGTLKNYLSLLADFGLSKSLLEPATISVVRGVQAYVDPILLSGRLNYTDKYEKSSDIYSFVCLCLREKREIGMPMQYIDTYEKCWSPDPSLRPEISEILYRLKNLSEEPIYAGIDIPSTETSYPNRESLSNTVVQHCDLTSEMQLFNFNELIPSDSFRY
ncbi:kinase-like protein [Gigaspora margarita]|uniref:Kinase-like protein n=1 Tax=Gigaspora margarita TaxID=4874 RepID=A0A8H4EVK7_GIGMA|nr:kinase-like protein [Gigaspora margarita]